jgi:hypothetical protein
MPWSIVYTTGSGSADETSLRLLANWHDDAQRPRIPGSTESIG